MASWRVSSPEKRTFEAGEVRRVDVRLTAGKLSLVGTDGPPRVEITKVSAAPVVVELVDGVLSVRNEHLPAWPGFLQPLWWWLNGGKRFETDVSIAVPYETPGELWIANGSVVVSTVHADVGADCVNGRITVFGVDGALRAKVINGPIEALGCAGQMRLETVNGEITVADSAASRIRAKTVSGSLTADLDNPPSASHIELETISGEITVRVREDSDLDVRISAAHGRVSSDFPEMTVRREWGATVNGRLGMGTGTLTVRAVGGNIALLRRPVDAAFAEGES